MQTLTSRDVQKNFGPIADMVAAGQGVRVTKYGRPAFLIIPESDDSDEILRRVAGRRLTALLKSGARFHPHPPPKHCRPMKCAN
jgi:antitoxin (DNA-binding transcriptional repressor) of toxin-antitoxin stability system